MLTALVLINVERTKINDVADQLASIDGVSEVYSVTGRYDLVAILRVEKNEQLAELVTQELTMVEGIVNTESMVAFRAHSRHDLEGMFDLGN